MTASNVTSSIISPLIPNLTAVDFKFDLEHVSDSQDCFDGDMLLDDRDPADARFAVAVINISDILDSRGGPLPMTDLQIEANGDREYIDEMTEVAREKGAGCFPPVVVLDRGTHFEWMDGQHRVTALHRAGIMVTAAYIQRGDF